MIPLCLAFVDYKKAFDSVERNAVLSALDKCGVNPNYVDLLTEMTTGCSTEIKLFSEPCYINICKGVRQGDTTSPKKSHSSLFDDEFGAPVVRNVPIRIVPSVHHNEPPAYSTIFAKGASSADESLSSNTRIPPQTTSQRSAHGEAGSGTACVPRAGPSITDRPLKAAAVKDCSSGGLSKLHIGTATNNVSSYTVSMPHCCDLRSGDRVVWFDRVGVPRRGTVKWTGRLKGHSSIYVGVDFDEEIGGGTGRYQGLELFRTELNHAGLLPLSACMKEADMEVSPTERSNEPPTTVVPPTRLQRSCVEVDFRNERRFGVVKWIGYAHNEDKRNNDKSVAVEIEGLLPREWPSTLEVDIIGNGSALYRATGPVAIVPVSSLHQDNRFATPIVGESPSIGADLCSKFFIFFFFAIFTNTSP
ncbi:unnamed protein product [Toxocara canis]|uniref:CAP-Gly domain-containing protein n=1 Tax=Toxocara canis TaxID=6265 RepID=A0A183V8S7_TOXCA|nr:unnamed protein product [Toxocara canis]